MEALLPTAIYRCFLPSTLLQPRPFVRVSLRVEHSAVHRVPLLIGKSLRAELALDELHLKRTCRVGGALHEFYAAAKCGLARGDHQATDSSANMLSLRLQSLFDSDGSTHSVELPLAKHSVNGASAEGP